MFNLTIAQFSPQVGNKISNMSKMKTLILDAKKQNSNLVLFPELSLTGYITSKEVYELAETLEGPSIRGFRGICKENEIYSAFSFIEKNEKEEVYISCALIDDQGDIVGVYRKTHQFDQETTYFEKGNEIPVFTTKFGKIGIMICFDLEFPEVARTLKKKGAELILVPLANMKPYEKYQEIYTKSRAMENEIPIAICNQSEPLEGIDFFGQSIAVDLYGTTLIEMGNTEQIATVTIDLANKKDRRLNYIKKLRPEVYEI